jgi:putative heme-binding domain-containing protein
MQKLGVYARMHAIWILVHNVGEGLREQSALIGALLELARTDADVRVRVQAVRAVADLTDPVLTKHRLDARPDNAPNAGWAAERLAELAKDQDPRVLLEIAIALGRLRWGKSPDWLKKTITKPDAPLAHAAMQTMRRSRNWQSILHLLDEPDSQPMRAVALRAVAEQYETAVVDDLIARLRSEKDAGRRRAYADALTRVYKKPGPWVYWGYSPRFRPANTVAWERSEHIAEALDGMLADPDRAVRLSVLQRMQREKVPARLATLGRWLEDEHQPERVAAILASVRDQPTADVRRYLGAAVRDKQHSAANRLAALAIFAQGLDEQADRALLELAEALEDGPVLAEALRGTARLPRPTTAALLLQKVKSADGEVRAAAVDTLGKIGASAGREPVLALLDDKDVRVRRAAAAAAGRLVARQAIEPLLKLATDSDAEVRRASLDSLRLLREPRVVPLAVAALGDRPLELKALECLGELGGPEQAGAVADLARRSPSADVPAAAVRVLTGWRGREGSTAQQRQDLDRAVADIHGANGILVRWQVRGPLSVQDAAPLVERLTATGGRTSPARQGGDLADWQTLFASGTEARVPLAAKGTARDGVWLATTELAVAEPTPVEFLASSSGSLQVWLNGKSVQRRDQGRTFQVDSDRFAATLAKGSNRLLVQAGPSAAAVEFHLRFRRKSAKVEQEKLTQAALARAGNPERGRKLFLDVEKSQCLKCHRLGDQGERIGPELTGVGSRFSRIYIVESILEPSRTIAPSFGTLVISLKNGKVLSGVKVAETETTLTLADNQGQKHELKKADIDEQQTSPISTMPEELEKRFTEEEFVDLIAFLVSQKQGRGP